MSHSSRSGQDHRVQSVVIHEGIQPSALLRDNDRRKSWFDKGLLNAGCDATVSGRTTSGILVTMTDLQTLAVRKNPTGMMVSALPADLEPSTALVCYHPISHSLFRQIFKTSLQSNTQLLSLTLQLFEMAPPTYNLPHKAFFGLKVSKPLIDSSYHFPDVAH